MQAKEVKLPVCGKVAVLRRPTGRDLVEAERASGKEAGERAYNLALIARITQLEGRGVPFEDLLDFDAEDIGALMTVDLGFTESHPAPS